MFDYTSMILQETINDIKKIGHIAKYSTQGFYIVYLIYVLIAGTGFWFINAPLLALAIAYLIYDLHNTNHKTKSQDKTVKKIYNRIKQTLKFFPLCVSLYSLYLTVDTVNPFTLIATAFMLISWLLAFVFDVLTSVIEKRIELIKAAFKEDWETMIQPVKSVGNIIKKVAGQPVTTPAPTKTQIKLQQMLEKHKARKEKAKAQKKLLKQQAKQAAKAKKAPSTLQQTPDVNQLPAQTDESGDNE